VRAGPTPDERRASDEKLGLTEPKANPRSQKPNVENRWTKDPRRKTDARGTHRTERSFVRQKDADSG